MLLEEIALYLVQKEIGIIGQDIFLAGFPPTPDNCIALFEYGGSPPDLHWAGEYPGLQVRTRSYDYRVAREKIVDIMLTLHGVCEKVLSNNLNTENKNNSNENDDDNEEEEEKKEGTRYLLIRALHSPEILKKDENGRVELFINFKIIKEV